MNQTDPTAASVEERVARHLAARDWLTDDDRWVNSTAAFRADYLTAARKVIALVRESAPAVLPEPTGRADEFEFRGSAEIRADVLDEAADIAEDVAENLRGSHEIERSNGAMDVMSELRRLAVEADGNRGDGAQQQPDTEARCTCADAGACFAPAGHYADCPQSAVPVEPAAADSEETRHTCGNCEGVDPDTCLTNPDRPAEPPV